MILIFLILFLYLYITFWVIIDLNYLLHKCFKSDFMPISLHFLPCFAVTLYLNFWDFFFWVYVSKFLLFWLFICCYFNFFLFAFFLFFTFVIFKNFNKSAITFLSFRKLANYLLLPSCYQFIPLFSNFWTSFFFNFFYMQHLIYRYLIIYIVTLYYQHSGILIVFILAKNFFTALCSTFS